MIIFGEPIVCLPEPITQDMYIPEKPHVLLSNTLRIIRHVGKIGLKEAIQNLCSLTTRTLKTLSASFVRKELAFTRPDFPC